MKAISPVIATVIIVSVAIAISIAVALWLSGMVGGFTQTENLQILTGYAEPVEIYANTSLPQPLNITINNQNKTLSGYTVLANYTGSGWTITIQVKNTGTVSATIDNIFVNGIPISNEQGVIAYMIDDKTITPGETTTIHILLGSPFTHGQMVNIKIHTASGRDYPKTITLP